MTALLSYTYAVCQQIENHLVIVVPNGNCPQLHICHISALKKPLIYTCVTFQHFSFNMSHKSAVTDSYYL